jgi:hypothetical protein
MVGSASFVRTGCVAVACLAFGCSSQNTGGNAGSGSGSASGSGSGSSSGSASEPDASSGLGSDAGPTSGSGSDGGSGSTGGQDATADANEMDAGDSASPEDAGGDGSIPCWSPEPNICAPTPPAMLSQTGLFKSVAADGGLELADGVQPYAPGYVLWADGATKQRWIYLPPGQKIDTTDIDHWKFPVGTKLFKEFDDQTSGQRLETRMVWHYGADQTDYVFVTYWWKPGMTTDAPMADPNNGEQMVNGTMHNIPAVGDCIACHASIVDNVLGFGAIQMAAPAATGLTVTKLVAQGLLTKNPTVSLAIPGTPAQQAALGYLHANCSHCHNPDPGNEEAEQDPDPTKWLNFRIAAGTLTVEDTNTYKTAVNQPTTDLTDLYAYRIFGGSTAKSAVWNAMDQRFATNPNVDSRLPMPPIASNAVDDAGVTTIGAWINTLPAPK